MLHLSCFVFSSLLFQTIAPVVVPGHNGTTTTTGRCLPDVVLVDDHRQSILAQQRLVNLTRSERTLLCCALTSSNVLYSFSEYPLLVMEDKKLLPPSFQRELHLRFWRFTVAQHFTIMSSSVNDESVLITITSDQTTHTRHIRCRMLYEGFESFNGSVGYNVGIVVQTSRNVWDKPASIFQSLSMADNKSRSSNIPPRWRFQLPASDRRRSSLTSNLGGGSGTDSLNPREHLLPSMGFDGLKFFICCWVINFGLSGLQCFKYFWVLGVVFGMLISIGVTIGKGNFRKVRDHWYQ